MSAALQIDIWSDVMCPWCVIGYRNLEAALGELAGEVSATVRWLPFELNPAMPPEGEESGAHVARKYGRTPEQAADARAMMAERARAAGFSFDYVGEGAPPPAMLWNTFAAHKLLRWALASDGPDAQNRLALALFRAHFQQRRNLGQAAVLLAVAAEAGLDPAAAQAALGDAALGDAVRVDQQRAWDMNVSGVPAMVFDGRFMVPGAQEPETYRDVIRKVIARRG